MLILHNLRHAALGLFIALGVIISACQAKAENKSELVVAGGCFWCVEADFESVPGVVDVISGYSGGTVKNPSYKQVTKGGTGHYEAVKIVYDPAKVSRPALLHAFFRSIDPTDAGGQFCDRGESYRTAVFTSGSQEAAVAERAKSDAAKALGQDIVTPILPLAEFYPAEAYHQGFYQSDDIILTRFGPRKKSTAYKLYRKSCGRDAAVKALWGDAALFASS